MIIIYRPLSRSGFFPRVVKTFGPQVERSHILLTHFPPMLNEDLERYIGKRQTKKPHKAQGQQHSLSMTQINKGLDKEQ